MKIKLYCVNVKKCEFKLQFINEAKKPLIKNIDIQIIHLAVVLKRRKGLPKATTRDQPIKITLPIRPEVSSLNVNNKNKIEK